MAPAACGFKEIGEANGTKFEAPAARALAWSGVLGYRNGMLQHNSYFEGLVQSIGFERNGRRYTAGVFAVGAFHFNTDSPERMTVVSGEMRVRLPGEVSRVYPTGTSFEVPAKSGFDVETAAPAAYLCEFL